MQVKRLPAAALATDAPEPELYFVPCCAFTVSIIPAPSLVSLVLVSFVNASWFECMILLIPLPRVIIVSYSIVY